MLHTHKLVKLPQLMLFQNCHDLSMYSVYLRECLSASSFVIIKRGTQPGMEAHSYNPGGSGG